MTPTRIRVGTYYWGMGASLITLLTGGWLILAPFALGYQAAPFALGYQAHTAGSWTDMTENDVWVGAGVVILSVAGLAFFARALVAALRAGGVVRARPRRQARPRPVVEQAVTPAVPSAVTPATAAYRPDLEQTMAALAAALAADLTERRKGDNKVDNEHLAGPATMGRG